MQPPPWGRRSVPLEDVHTVLDYHVCFAIVEHKDVENGQFLVLLLLLHRGDEVFALHKHHVGETQETWAGHVQAAASHTHNNN